MNKKIFLIVIICLLTNCNRPKNHNDMGLVTKLPKGKYIIFNYGSRHIVKCVNSKNKIYYLNDSNFKLNGIYGHDAHQYSKKTIIIIK